MFKLQDGRETLFQWDLDRKIIVSDPTIKEVHFCNKTSDCSLVVEVYEEDGLHLANVPNILLQTDWPIYVYAYCGDCYTKTSDTFKVNKRSRPDDYVYTETEVKRWEDLEKRVNETLDGVAAAEEARNAAEEGRAAAEDARDAAETSRDVAFTKLATELETTINSGNEVLAKFKTNSSEALTQFDIDSSAALIRFDTDSSATITQFNTDSSAAIEQFNTDATNLIESTYNTVSEIVNEGNAVIAELSIYDNVIDSHEKRITNIEHHINQDYFSTDDSIAYKKVVPTGICPYAEAAKIGGMTRKCTNLIPFPYENSSKTLRGITYTVNGDGSIHIKGTCTAQSDFLVQYNTPLTLPAGTYVISGNNGSIGVLYASIEGIGIVYSTGNGTSFTLTKETPVRIAISVYEGETVDKTIYPMLNEGTTALPYEPYFEGLRSAKVTEVESVEKNLFDENIFIDLGFTKVSEHEYFRNNLWTIPNKPIFVNASGVSGSFTISAKLKYLDVGTTSGIYANVVYTDGTTVMYPASNKVFGEYFDYVAITDASKTVDYIIFTYGSSTVDTSIKNLQIERGSVATEYEPYTKHTLPIPEVVQALDGYGWGVNESVYNYIDFEKKQFVKRVKKVVFDGSADENLTIGIRGTEFTLFKAKISEGYNYSTAIINQDIPYKVAFDANDAHFYVNEGEVLFALSNSIATDVATLKTYLASNPIEVIYELAEPIVTDISDILPADNFIEVEGGGTITAANDYGYAVPSSITYLFKEGSI